MTKKTEEQRLDEARSHFYSYRFREAYQLYRRVFSTLPFHLTEAYLEHIGSFCRTLVELGRIEELEFYIPILESHYEKNKNPHVGYALAYSLSCRGSKNRARELFEKVRVSAPNSDLRTKAIMMLAHYAESDSDRLLLIHSITEPAQDPHLAKMLEIWRCIALRFQGRGQEAVIRLKALSDSLSPTGEFWYCSFSAKDALIRSYLHLDRYSEARVEIEEMRASKCAALSRTTARHVSELNDFYQKRLSVQSIFSEEKRGQTVLTFKGDSVQIKNDQVRGLVRLFQKTPVITLRRISSSLHLSEDKMKDLQARLTDKLEALALPTDSLLRKNSSLHLVPALRSAVASRMTGE